LKKKRGKKIEPPETPKSRRKREREDPIFGRRGFASLGSRGTHGAFLKKKSGRQGGETGGFPETLEEKKREFIRGCSATVEKLYKKKVRSLELRNGPSGQEENDSKKKVSRGGKRKMIPDREKKGPSFMSADGGESCYRCLKGKPC